MVCHKCHKKHSLKLKNTKTYPCGITVIGTKWDTSTDPEDRTFCWDDIRDDDSIDSAMSLVEHLIYCGFSNPMVVVGNPVYGKWEVGTLEVRGEGNKSAIPLIWEDHPVFVGE